VKIEQVVVDYLETITAVTALVGARIYQLKLRQGTAYPAIRVQVIDDSTPYHLRGEVNLASARVQVDAYHNESGTDPYATLMAVSDAVLDALSGVRFTVGTTEVTGAFQVLRRTEPEVQPSGITLLRDQQDFRLRSRRVS
jgi:hypothetical protein